MLRYLHLIISLSVCALSTAQSFKFRHFGETDGMGSRYVNTLNQDPMGRLLIGTGEGLFRYDGFRFSTYTRKDSLADNLVESSCTLSDGSILFGHSNGDLTRYFNGKLEPIRLSKFFRSRVTSITQDSHGSVWVASQNSGIIRFDSGWVPTHYESGLEDYNLYSIAHIANELWAGTDMGLIQIQPVGKSGLDIREIPGFPLTTFTHLFIENPDQILAASEDEGLFRIKGAGGSINLEPITYSGEKLDKFHIRHVRSDKSGMIWICTNNFGLISLSSGTESNYDRMIVYTEQGGQKNQSTRVSFADRENNLWIGTIGSGLIRLEDNYFSLYSADGADPSGIGSVFFANGKGLYGGTGCIYELNEEGIPVGIKFGPKDGVPNSRITSISEDDKGVLWIGTLDLGLWKKGPDQSRFSAVYLSDDFLNLKINAIITDGEILYAGTDFGAYVLKNGKPLMHLTIENGLSGNVIRCFFRDSKNRIWIGTTTSEFNYIENGGIRKHPSMISNSSFPVRTFTEDQNGEIWAGTEGIGIISVTADQFTSFNKLNGLYSDFCYSLTCAINNKIWAGHRGALSVIDLNNERIIIKSPGKSGDVYFQDNAVAMTAHGEIVFGTNFGLLRYDPSLDRLNSTPPMITIDQIIISDVEYPIDATIRLKAGEYKLEFFYSGISLSNAETVRYQYLLEGYDDRWSALTADRRSVYNHLPPGSYVFKVKAYNEDGFSSDEISTFSVTIERPFWQQWWFILMCLIMAFATIRIVIMRRERFLKENQEYLKRELAARTQEVVQQKELLEVKNKDITDSILYAKNIQTAVLPPDGQLESCFSDSFVYYQPRDIVSGDFYWIEESNETVLVACADCTGHGVPGAFMSLIGSMLMKEVVLDTTANAPNEFLSRLHERLQSIFFQPGRTESLSDGMDVSLIEINRKSGRLRIASANRPVFLMRGTEVIELKGDRNSIGGSDLRPGETFTLHEYQIERGDMIYLFSDGITDQFGGDRGKKLKRTGLREMIHHVSSLPMNEQFLHIRESFNTWRGALPQIDDVLLIGIRF